MSDDVRRVGVIGLGHMGRRIAGRLVDAGYQVTVWDQHAETAGSVGGAEATVTPAEVSSRCQLTLSVLANDDVVRDVVLGAGVIDEAPDGAVIADLSTTSAAMAIELAEAASDRGLDALDIEMSGSTPQVEAGELSLLVGGEQAVLDRVRGPLEQLASTILLMGPHGSGAQMKLVVNTLLGDGMQALAEAVTLGQAMGLDRSRLLDGLGQLAVVAPAHKPKLANIASDEYPVAFALGLMHKDFELVLDEARRHGVEMPATEASARCTAEALDQAQDDEDFSAVARVLLRHASIRPAT